MKRAAVLVVLVVLLGLGAVAFLGLPGGGRFGTVGSQILYERAGLCGPVYDDDGYIMVDYGPCD